ncbi:hypothetical protein [Neobacillus vireti]|uniref:hypothetical protein n=1 Tax=Neobacillus vireti TaxID=220686 RepID=UPI0030006350
MEKQIIEIKKSKQDILEEIKKLFRINPLTEVIVFVVTACILGTIFHVIKDFGMQLTSDFMSAFINLFFAWNLGFGLFQGGWRLYNSRKVNKVLIPKLEQFIGESEEKSYAEIEAEVYEMVKVGYAEYTEKYNKLQRIYWTSFKLSFALPLIALVIWFVLQ